MRAFVLAMSVLAGCKAPEPPLVVFAASSLTDVFRAMEPDVEAGLETDVAYSFAGSQTLRVQIEQGAPADVFASANRSHIDALAAAGLVEAPVHFADNALVAVVPVDSSIDRFEDLGRAERVVVGTPEVPVGAYTQVMLGRLRADDEALAARLESHVVSREHNVRLVLAKVELGEADAAFVYRTDVSASRRVRVVEIPASFRVRAGYFVSAARDARPEARAFVELLTGPIGHAALRASGFAAP